MCAKNLDFLNAEFSSQLLGSKTNNSIENKNKMNKNTSVMSIQNSTNEIQLTRPKTGFLEPVSVYRFIEREPLAVYNNQFIDLKSSNDYGQNGNFLIKFANSKWYNKIILWIYNYLT